MIIEEKGMVRAIKRAHATEGYAVLNLGAQVAIYTDGWFVRCGWSKLPRKALATIVEHMGMIPGDGDALSIIKGEDPQSMMPEVVGQDVETWTGGDKNQLVSLVPVLFRGLQLYQVENGGACYGTDPGGLGIMERAVATQNAAYVVAERHLLWEHDGEMVAVLSMRKSQYWAEPWERDVWNALEGVNLHKKEERPG